MYEFTGFYVGTCMLPHNIPTPDITIFAHTIIMISFSSTVLLYNNSVLQRTNNNIIIAGNCKFANMLEYFSQQITGTHCSEKCNLSVWTKH